MAWAKEHAVRPRFHLGRSGLMPPDPGLVDPGWSEARTALSEGTVAEQAGRVLADRIGQERRRLLLTLGTSHGLYLVCRCLLRTGDLVLVEQPAYEVLAGLPQLCGARVARFVRSAAEGYRLPRELPERIEAERPRLVILSNPHNPTATFLSPEELEPAVRALDAVGGRLLVDEVYLEFQPDPEQHTAARLGEAVVACSSLTKAHGLGALRFGWMVASADLCADALRLNDYIAVNYPAPSAAVGLAALDRLDELRERAVATCESRRPIVERWVASRPDVRWHPSEVGAMAWLELGPVGDTASFVDGLLRRYDTLVVPGEFFEAPGWVRLGFGIPIPDLEEGLARIGRALDDV
jgi:aspartate/methionine/tyrosine aminotransferase